MVAATAAALRTNGLDPAGVVEIRTLLHDLADRHGTTIFLSSHLLAEVARTDLERYFLRLVGTPGGIR